MGLTNVEDDVAKNEEQKFFVADTFKNRSILITGASGFLGKVLVEKLLYSIPSINSIFLLIRPLPNETINERLNKIIQVCFFF